MGAGGSVWTHTWLCLPCSVPKAVRGQGLDCSCPRGCSASHAEGQQPTRKSISFNKLMVGTLEPLDLSLCATALRGPAAQAHGTTCSGPQCPVWQGHRLQLWEQWAVSVPGAQDLGHLTCVPAVVASKKLSGELGCLLNSPQWCCREPSRPGCTVQWVSLVTHLKSGSYSPAWTAPKAERGLPLVLIP